MGGATNRFVGPPHPTLSPRPAGGEGKGARRQSHASAANLRTAGRYTFPGQPCASRERVPSAARRVRVSRHFVYRSPILSIDAQLESTPNAANLDRCRAPHMVSPARSAPVEIQIPATTSSARFHRRLRLYRVPAGNRSRWWSAFRERSGHNPNGLAPKPGLESAPVLEQRRSKQYQRGHRDYSAHSQIRVDPHPPSPAGWAPPSPALRERGCCAGL